MNKGIIFNADNNTMYRRSIGAHRLATYLRQEYDWDIEIVDFAAFWSLEHLKEFAIQRINSDTKFIGFSYTFISDPQPNIENFGVWLKKIYPHVQIILGGPNIYRYKNSYTDYNVYGFSERALVALLKYLFSNGEKPKFNLLSTSGKALDANTMYPSFPMQSLMVKYEPRDFIQAHEWLGVEFARGCKFKCTFCNYPVLGVKGDYSRDADDFEIQMRDAYDNWGVKHYYVTDETFNDRTEKITKFADVVERLNFSPYYTGFIRADLLVKRPLDRIELLRMNFLGQFYGIETFYPAAMKSIGKHVNPTILKDGLLTIKEYFTAGSDNRYRGHISLIAGLPHEPIDSIYESGRWLLTNWQKQAYSIYPLEIPIGTLDLPSLISSNYTKYGYSVASELNEYETSRSCNSTSKFLMWANEHMTVKDADRIAAEIESWKFQDNNDFRQGNFSLLKLNLPHDLNDRLLVADGIKLALPSEFISNYIHKKLSI